MNGSPRLIRNKVTEKEIRDYLNEQGFWGDAARFESLELFAVERPGWVQVFTFCVNVPGRDGTTYRFWGVNRDDERSGRQIRLLDNEDEQLVLAKEWSEDLIQSGREPLTMGQRMLMFWFVVILSFAIVSVLVAN